MRSAGEQCARAHVSTFLVRTNRCSPRGYHNRIASIALGALADEVFLMDEKPLESDAPLQIAYFMQVGVVSCSIIAHAIVLSGSAAKTSGLHV